MDDTSPAMRDMVRRRHREMTPAERIRAADRLYGFARAIVESSLPADLTGPQRQVAVARRFYAGELPEAAFEAYARHLERANSNQT